jgi:hypothetical protein
MNKQQLALLATPMAELARYFREHPDELGVTVQSIGRNGKGTQEELLTKIREWKKENGGVL